MTCNQIVTGGCNLLITGVINSFKTVLELLVNEDGQGKEGILMEKERAVDPIFIEWL